MRKGGQRDDDQISILTRFLSRFTHPVRSRVEYSLWRARFDISIFLNKALKLFSFILVRQEKGNGPESACE